MTDTSEIANIQTSIKRKAKHGDRPLVFHTLVIEGKYEHFDTTKAAMAIVGCHYLSGLR